MKNNPKKQKDKHNKKQNKTKITKIWNMQWNTNLKAMTSGEHQKSWASNLLVSIK